MAQERNEKTILIGDTKISTVFAQSFKELNNSSHFHTHAQYELFIFESGNGYMNSADKKIRFSRNTAILIPPHTEHDRISSNNIPVSLISVTFNFKKLSDYKVQNNEKLFKYFEMLMPKSNQIIVLKDKYFGEFFRNFTSQTEDDPVLASILISNMLESLFLHILRLISKTQSPISNTSIYSYKSSAILNEVVLSKNIDDYMDEPGCTLTGLANQLNMCPRNAQRVMKSLYGMNFSQKLAQNRLKKAAYFIKNTDLSLTEIAKKVNYNQYASFRKAFIAYYNISPSEYRIKFKSTHKNNEHKNPRQNATT